jgi:hypothetical protein
MLDYRAFLDVYAKEDAKEAEEKAKESEEKKVQAAPTVYELYTAQADQYFSEQQSEVESVKEAEEYQAIVNESINIYNKIITTSNPTHMTRSNLRKLKLLQQLGDFIEESKLLVISKLSSISGGGRDTTMSGGAMGIGIISDNYIISAIELVMDEIQHSGNDKTDNKNVKNIFELSKQVFIKLNIPLRTCSLNLSQKNIDTEKFKVCLEFQLGNCKGPCVGKQSLENYDEGLRQIKHILKGNFNEIITHYKKIQNEHIEKMEYEEAQKIQYKIGNLKDFQSQSVIVNPALGNLDVFGIDFLEDKAFVSYLSVRNGTITNSKTITFQEKIEEDKEDLLLQSIAHFQTLFGLDATEVIIPYPLNFSTGNWKITFPKAGEKKKLLDLATSNSRFFKEEEIKKNMLHLEEKHGSKVALIEKVRLALSLKERPLHIECFDNSNFHGEYPVSAMVCFKEGMPCKSEYRRYNVQDVKGINDFATMKEVVYLKYWH